MIKKTIQVIIAIITIITISFYTAHATTNHINKIAAIVGNEIITTKELAEKTKLVINNLSTQNITLPPKEILEHQVLNKMILDQIQLQMAKQLAIEVDSTSINHAIENLAKQQKMSVSEYKKSILQSGLKFEDFREQVKTEIILSRLQQREVGNEIRISNADIDGYLNSPAGQDNSGIEYHLGHILIAAPDKNNNTAFKKAESKAKQVVTELKQGKDFKQLAMANSADIKALDGGDLGWRQLKEIPSIFVKEIPNMQIDEIIGPIQSSSGFHIIKLYHKRFGKKQNYLELQARQILIKPNQSTSDQEAKTLLSKLRQQIIDGKEFSKIAAQKSQELHTAARGGSLGWISETSTIPEFWKNINTLSTNQISQPFKTELGWHLVQITNKRQADHSTEAIRNQAAEILRERKFNEILEIWLKKIRDEAKVDVLL